MFDALPETRSEGKIVATRSLSTAALVHGLVIGLVVGAALLARVDAGEDPPQPYEFVRVLPVLIPEGESLTSGGGGPRTPSPTAPAPEPRPPEPSPEPVQPVFVEDLPPAPPVTAPPSPAPSNGEETGTGSVGKGGTGTGTGEGDGSGDGRGGTDAGRYGVLGGVGPPDEGPLIVSGDVRAPVLIRRVEPLYPEVARRARVEGDVILQAVVGTDGRVESVTVLRSVPLLDRAAVEAVSQWTYKPGRLRGLPVKVFFTVHVSFRLN